MTDVFTADPDKFWDRVDRSGECWVWTGSATSGGYGNLRRAGKSDYAHRVSYRLSGREIPKGFHVDHLCRNTRCVRPEHLEAVPPVVNIRRGASGYGGVRTECRHGHDITDPANVYTQPDGGRRCRVCSRAITARQTAERRERGDRRKLHKTECVRGHAFDEGNTRVNAKGHQKCRACARENEKKYREARKA